VVRATADQPAIDGPKLTSNQPKVGQVAPWWENVETNSRLCCIVFFPPIVFDGEGWKDDVTKAKDAEACQASKCELADLFQLCFVDVKALNSRSDC
jgi:hypothetical protein